jgi:hypothetical protein
LLFSSALKSAIRKVQENQAELILNGTHQLLFYADDANHLEDNLDTIQETERNVASKEVHLEVNAMKTKCMLLSHP